MLNINNKSHMVYNLLILYNFTKLQLVKKGWSTQFYELNWSK